MTSLPKQIADRLRAGALVVVVQEADELLALSAAEAAAATCTPIKVVSAADAEVTTCLEEHPEGQGTLILLDYLAVYGDNPLSARMVREVALQSRPEGQQYSRLILIEQPATKIPPTVAGDTEIITSPLPSIEALQEELESFIESQDIDLEGNGETRYAVASAVAGLPRHEAARLFARAVIENKGLDAGWLRTAKAERIAERLEGALTFESTDSADVGGQENLRAWLATRRGAFGSAKAREYGLPEPKGLLLLGVPGGGKSLMARTVAREWSLPLLRLDAGRLFGSLVGQSEQQTRQAIEAAEACAPCVLWVDEIEKGLAGSGGGSGDSGTSARVFGALLTWLQEKSAPVFVVATANRVKDLPPELLRKGRFDDIFFVGLPTPYERRDIARIHLKRRNRDVKLAPAIAEATEGYSGAEIEQVIIDGLFAAFADDARDLTLTDVTDACKATVPLSKTMGEEIKQLEAWAAGRARPAAAPDTPNKTAKPRRRRRGPNLEK